MADFFCTLLDFRSLATIHNSPLFLPSNRYYSFPLHSHRSRISRIRRRPLHLSPLSVTSSPTPSSSELDVISTHEHSDGSLIFRFGDPNEVAKNVKKEESKTVKEDIEGESKDVSSVLVVVEGDNETELMAEKADTEITVSGSTEMADHTDSIDSSSNTVAVVEGESESFEKMLEGSSDTELPVLTSTEEVEGISTPDIERENIENVEEGLNEEYEDSSPVESVIDEGSKVESDIGTVELSEKETADVTSTLKEMEVVSAIDIEQTEDVEEGFNEESADSLIDTSILNKTSEMVNNISTVALSEKETADVTSTVKEMEIASAVDIEQTEDVEEGFNEESADSLIDASILDKSSEMVNNTVALSEKETADVTSTVKEMEVASAVDLEQTENVEEGLDEESADSLIDASILDKSSEMVNNRSAVALSETETADVASTVKEMAVASAVDIEHTENVEEGLNEESADSLIDATILDKSSEMVNNISTVALSEIETGDISSTDINVEQSGNEEEGVDEEHEESSTENASDKSPEVENNTTTLELSEKETGEVTSMTDENIDVPENGALQASLETDVTTDVSPISEQQNVEEMQNEAAEDDRESFDSNLVSQIEEANLEAKMGTVPIGTSSESDMNDTPALEMQNAMGNGKASDTSDAEAKSPPMEAAMNLSIDSEDIGSAGSGPSGMPNETVGYVSEKEMIQVGTVPPQLEDDLILEEETDIEIVEESTEDDASENLKEGGDLVEASVDEATVNESIPMSQETSMTNLVLSSGAALLPHPSKALTGGEDAFFIAGRTWLGVADGVGQWSLQGTTPGVYAQELISNCERSIDNGDSIYHPLQLLNLSLSETHSPGSSTVLIARFDGQAFHVANVGDSGFIVLRHGAIYKRSSPMHHVFHFPIQIQSGDDPSSLAEFYTVDLEEEDVIITATDGLLDNLYDQEISSIVMKSLAADKKLEEIAGLLAMKAQEIGSSAYVRTPFGDNAQAAGFAGYSGGKLDDVAVIVSVVQRQ